SEVGPVERNRRRPVRRANGRGSAVGVGEVHRPRRARPDGDGDAQQSPWLKRLDDAASGSNNFPWSVKTAREGGHGSLRAEVKNRRVEPRDRLLPARVGPGGAI